MKLKKIRSVKLLFIYPAILFLLNLYLVCVRYRSLDRYKDMVWSWLWDQNYGTVRMQNFLLVFVVILALKIVYVEYREDTLREIMSMPVSRKCIVGAKYIVLSIILLLFLVLCNLGIGVAAITEGLSGWMLFADVMIETGKQFLMLAGTCSMQLYFTIRYPNPSLVLIIAIIGIPVANSILIIFGQAACVFPYSQILAISKVTSSMGLVAMMISILLCIVFLVHSLRYCDRIEIH